MKDMNCAYCAEGALVDAFGIKILDLAASRVYLFREQSHRGRVIVASKHHVSELVDLSPKDRRAFLDDVAAVAEALHGLFKPQKVNYGAYGDTGGHLHFHLVPKYADDPFEWGDVFAMNPKRTFLSDADYADLVAKIKAALYIGSGADLRSALEKMRAEVAADGKVDLAESAFLLEALKPLEGSGATIDAFLAALRAVRDDGVVTNDESKRILALLDGLLA